ncbi:MAG: glucose-6-phosphate isomerase [Candidatus Marinarcus sp.]|uniref:glucose-6-phosphate isomerase n=1 Tax=Candidatus Marinarcus sp. TaxID=3100987 RepID=UPI003AFF858A
MQNIQFFDSSKMNGKLLESIKEESSDIGYYSLTDQNVDSIIDFASNVKQKNIVVVGIGGSSLGTAAVYDFLRYSHGFEKILYFCESTDPVLLNSTFNKLDLNDTLFIIISKSGSTIETVSIFKYILSLVPLNKEQFVILSDKGSSLHKLASDKELSYFEIPSNVGGRFSVLSCVGLVPLAILGVDIKLLLAGAKNIKESFFNKNIAYKNIINKASFYASNVAKYNINCLFSYSEAFRSFNDWYIQLWGESLGKKQLHSYLNVGLTPIGLIGPTDQHSFLQLIVEGKRDKSVTFIKIKDFDSNLKIPKITIPYLEELDFINGVAFSHLINKQADSIIESLSNSKDIPLDIIEIDKIDEHAIGSLFFYYELLTSVVAKMLDVNAYDQPGVEEGKKILRGFFN